MAANSLVKLSLFENEFHKHLDTFRQNGSKLLLLLWKNFLLQWRHPFQTVVEILAPVLFATLLMFLRTLIDPEPHAGRIFTSFSPRMVIIDDRYELDVAWAPSANPSLVKIMDDFVTTVNEERPWSRLELISFPNNTLLEKYWKNELVRERLLAVIRFDDCLGDKEDMDPKVNVTIRFRAELLDFGGKRNWKTNILYPTYQTPGPRDWMQNDGANPNYNAEGFLKIQKELSMAIIRHFSPNFNQTAPFLRMQRFPYPPWTADPLLQAVQTVVSLIFMLGFLYSCISIVRIITLEKEKQLKEALKIMGLPNWLQWMGWFIKTFAFLMLTVVIMVVLMKARWYPHSNYTVFTYSNAVLVMLFLALFVFATVTFCFAISAFFTKANTAAVVAGLVWFLSYCPYLFVQNQENVSLAVTIPLCLFSNTAMAFGFKLILAFEGLEEGVQWRNVWSLSGGDGLKFGHILIMLTVDGILYLLIALYVEAVLPGKYGVSQPWYFPFLCFRKNQTGTEYEPQDFRNDCFEPEPTDLPIGIQIRHLVKEFSDKTVVDNLSLNVYENQITVLLGHNGAGKTTTMAMLIGMLPPAKGTALVGGYDIRTSIGNVRTSLGFCPQHNILFDELTVKEHLTFFSRLKSAGNGSREVEHYLKLLMLDEKKDALSGTLSGGMQRKLSIGIALCGGSKVIILDEPTAGVDPAARRSLWDLLRSQREGRTILFTTHFMDEADFLGDRIAVMSEGRLQCCGSSFFLKKRFDSGYRLTLAKSKECNSEKITDLLRKYIPNAQIASSAGSELIYTLEESYSETFEQMFGDLENHTNELGIESYGVSLTTLEEVFMKVTNESTKEQNGYENRAYVSDPQDNENGEVKYCFSEPKEKNPTDETSLICNQILAMLYKRTLYIKRSLILLVLQNCIPVLFIIITMVLVRTLGAIEELPNLKIGLEAYRDPVTVLSYSQPNAYYHSYIENLKRNNMEMKDWKKDDMSEKMIEEVKEDPVKVRIRYLAGATFDHGMITAWFNNDPIHTPPLSLQLVLNSMLKAEASSNHSVEINHHPLPFSTRTKFRRLQRGNNAGFQLAFTMGFSMAFVSAFYVMFYIRERTSQFKHLQFVSGVKVFSFLASAFICDLLTFTFTSILMIATLAAFQEDSFRTAQELVLICFGASMITLMYFASWFFDTASTGFTRMTLLNVFTGIGTFIVIEVLSLPELGLKHVATALHWIFMLAPHYSFTSGVKNLYASHKIDQICNSIVDACTVLFPIGLCKTKACDFQKACCKINKVYALNQSGIGLNIIISLSFSVLMIVLILLQEYKILEGLCKSKRQFPASNQPDGAVLKEKQKVASLTLDQIRDFGLVTRCLSKFYKNFLAVDSLSISVHKGECFGLLGVNGAGKTTTFQILSGKTAPSLGDAWINGLSLVSNIKEVYKSIGYCPQSDGLLNELTCRETLLMFGLLRGFSFSDSKAEADRLASNFDFYKHFGKRVDELSGGNKRKLSTAVAFIGNPSVIFLDEPSSGMDPKTRHHFWNELCRARDSGKSIILTSHSMEECEALCTRLAIMVNGQLKCLGTLQHLKQEFSEGYTLTVKIRENGDAVEQHILEKFPNSTIREKHRDLITFSVDKSQPWSKMFNVMEDAKALLGIESYSLSQSTLEEVFISFTKHQR